MAVLSPAGLASSFEKNPNPPKAAVPVLGGLLEEGGLLTVLHRAPPLLAPPLLAPLLLEPSAGPCLSPAACRPWAPACLGLVSYSLTPFHFPPDGFSWWLASPPGPPAPGPSPGALSLASLEARFPARDRRAGEGEREE